MVNKPSQDGNPRSTHLTHPKVGVSDKGYRASRESALVKVCFDFRDLKNLSHCSGAVQGLLEKARFVELSFSNDDLEWVRERLSAEATGWGADVNEESVGNELIMSVKHQK